jgi:hypothetical protein
MSLSSVRSYMKTRCNALGFVEHKDAFNFENIARVQFNRAFHLQLGQVSGVKQNQTVQEVNAEVTVRLFFNGFRTPSDGVDLAIVESEKLIASCLKTENRLGGEYLKNLRFNSMSVEPFDSTNDNALVSIINFTADVLLDVEGEN